MANPYLQSNKWMVPKDPDDKRYYKFGFANDLTASNTTGVLATAIIAGVTVLEPPVILGTDVVVKLGGLDVGTSAQNFCTIRLECANGEQIDRTMWYVREDH